MRLKLKCKDCKIEFSQRKSLYLHIRIVHEREPVALEKGKVVKCDECEAEFIHKKNIYAHIRKFHNREPITKRDPLEQCEECEAKFTHKKHLYAHVRKVHNREPISNIDAELETHEFSSGHSFQKWLEINELKEISASKKLPFSDSWNLTLKKKYDLIIGLLNTVVDLSTEDSLKVEKLTDYSLSVLLKQDSVKPYMTQIINEQQREKT